MPKLLKLLVTALVVIPNSLMAVLYDIRLAKRGIEFVFFRFIPIATVPYENVAFVQRQSNVLSPITAYRFVNRFGPRYVIHKKRAWFSKYVVVSPSDNLVFERTLREVGVTVIDK